MKEQSGSGTCPGVTGSHTQMWDPGTRTPGSLPLLTVPWSQCQSQLKSHQDSSWHLGCKFLVPVFKLMQLEAGPRLDGVLSLLALLETRCQVRPPQQAPATRGGESPLGWPLHEDHTALLFPGARAEYEGGQRDRSWPRKKADQTRKTLEEACSHWASEVQAVFTVSISFLGLERWTRETWVGPPEQGGSPGAWSGQSRPLPVPPKHQGAGNRLCWREKAESGLQSSEALRRESKDRSVCEPRERALRGRRGQGSSVFVSRALWRREPGPT